MPTLQVKPPVVSGPVVTLNGTATPSGPNATITQIRLDWGDGSQTTGSFPATHTYPQLGTYRIRITVLDSVNTMATLTLPVTITSLQSNQPTGGPGGPTFQGNWAVSGPVVTIDGVATPSRPNATITQIPGLG